MNQFAPQGLETSELEAAFIKSCQDEIDAPKPGNVHIFAEGHGMTARDFLLSAESAAPALCRSGSSVGERILGAVEATFSAVGMNTNLGIILLCAPLAAAAQSGGDLRFATKAILVGLTKADAGFAFRAIVRASPAGLGEASRHDVRDEVDATLLEAMREAAGRDRVAFQYVSDFSDIFGTGMKALEEARRRGWPAPWPVVAAYLAFLAAFPDTHIARKHGLFAAERTQGESLRLRDRFMNLSDPATLLPDLLVFDHHLKDLRLNPGTSADLTVATVFADQLSRALIQRRNNG